MKRILLIIFILLIFIGLAKVITGGIDDIRRLPWNAFSPIFLVIAGVLATLANFVAAAAWRSIYGGIETRILLRDALKVWFYSLFGKYAPIGIGQTLGRVYLAREWTLSRTKVFVASVLEQEMVVLGACLLCAVAMIHSPLPFVSPIMIGLLIGVAALFSHPAMLKKATNSMLRMLKKEPIRLEFSGSTLLGWLFAYCVMWVLAVVGYVLFVYAFVPLPLNSLPAVAGIFLASFLAGYCAPFVPAGLGVREATLTALLSLHMPLAVAATVAVSFRLFVMSEEALSVLIAKRL